MREEAEKLIRELVPELQNLTMQAKLLAMKENYHSIESCKQCEGFVSVTFDDGQTISVRGIGVGVLYKSIHLEHIILANRVNQNALAVMNYNEHNIVSKYNVCKSFTEQSEEFYKLIVDILQ